MALEAKLARLEKLVENLIAQHTGQKQSSGGAAQQSRRRKRGNKNKNKNKDKDTTSKQSAEAPDTKPPVKKRRFRKGHLDPAKLVIGSTTTLRGFACKVSAVQPGGCSTLGTYTDTVITLTTPAPGCEQNMD